MFQCWRKKRKSMERRKNIRKGVRSAGDSMPCPGGSMYGVPQNLFFVLSGGRLRFCGQQVPVSPLPSLPGWDSLCGSLPLALLPCFPDVTSDPVPCLYDLFHNKRQSHTDNVQLKDFGATGTGPSKPPLHLPYLRHPSRPWLSKHPLP